MTLEIGPYTFGPILEVFGPDCERCNPDEVLFVDSPCVRRWQTVTVESPQAATLWNQKTSTPITCAGSSCLGDEIPEALYATDLVVTSGSTLDTDNLNVYYTGKFTNDGTVLGGGSVTKLVPTLYGDFNGNGDGDEIPDVARFNFAFCSCIGDVNCDILVDWNWDGGGADSDRAKVNINWDSPPMITSGPCSISCTP